MFAALWQFAVVNGLRHEGSSCGWAMLVCDVLILIGVGCLLFSLRRPKE